MINYEEALSIIKKSATSFAVKTEVIEIAGALGAITAEDIFVPLDVPTFHSSAMDGFAIDYREVADASAEHPVELKVIGMVGAGDLEAISEHSRLAPRQSIEIMTGAPILEGVANAVVRIEDVEVMVDSEKKISSIRISKPLKLGDNIRLSGSDYRQGDLLVRKDTMITPEVLMAMASTGVNQVKVRKKLKIGLIATGKEVVDYREKDLKPGMIRNTTSIYIQALVKKMGMDFFFYGIVPDSVEVFRQYCRQALDDEVDVLLSTGAVSMGKFDFIKDEIESLGGRIHFHKVAIRPGKPILFGELSNDRHRCAYFGLPGNQISTGVGMRFFVQPFVAALLGLHSNSISASLISDSKKPKDFRCFFKGYYRIENGLLKVEVLDRQNSYIVSSMVESNCWVELPESRDVFLKSELVNVYPLSSKEGLEV